jgi:CheY-like chemotaxis protein
LCSKTDRLIGLDLAGTLQRAGAQAVRPSARRAWPCNFDDALLDANLHGRAVDEIATALTRRDIPFVFVTGYSAEGLRTSFKHAPALTKPVNDRQLVATLLRPRRRSDNIVRPRSP